MTTMGWCSATEIMDAAVEAAERCVTAAWQIASGKEDVKTPALANALRQDPDLRRRLDDVMRPFVTRIATQLRDGDWDCIEESSYFDRFRQEMLGYDDQKMSAWLREQLHYAEDPDEITKWAQALQEHHNKEGQTHGR